MEDAPDLETAFPTEEETCHKTLVITQRETRDHQGYERDRKQGVLDKMYSSADMPDEEKIKRNEKRKASKRRGSRVSSVLTNTDESLGG